MDEKITGPLTGHEYDIKVVKRLLILIATLLGFGSSGFTVQDIVASFVSDSDNETIIELRERVIVLEQRKANEFDTTIQER